MHAYREAIRDPTDNHVVDYAATLYPGNTYTFGPGLEALSAQPDEPSHLHERLTALFLSHLV
jgi:hypothetical protein